MTEFNSSNAQTASVSSLGVDGWVSRTDGASSRQFLTDALGSVLATTDTTGTLKTQYTYEPYGKTPSTGEVSSNPFKFTGREDDGTGLYYYRARYYNPSFQRFISSDPIGLSGGMNTYEYANGDPLNQTDPFGLTPTNPAWIDPSWSLSRLLKEMHARGYTLFGPSKEGGGLIYRNGNSQIRIMPQRPFLRKVEVRLGQTGKKGVVG